MEGDVDSESLYARCNDTKYHLLFYQKFEGKFKKEKELKKMKIKLIILTAISAGVGTLVAVLFGLFSGEPWLVFISAGVCSGVTGASTYFIDRYLINFFIPKKEK